jgi:integrase
MGELATIDHTPPAPPVAQPPAASLLAEHHAPWASPDRAGGATASGSLATVATMAAQSRRAPTTRIDYTRIYIRFVDWLAGQLGRTPQVADLTEVALLAWRNQRETSGGRGGQGLAPSSLRTELAALRVLARKAGHPALALELALPRHSPAPPATISDDEYDRLLRMPDQRRSIGRRDAAILQVLGDAGLRSAELRGLRGCDLIRARRDSPRRSLRIVRGKGGRGRTVRLTKAADEALDRWLALHPLRLELRGAAATVLPAAAPPDVAGAGGQGRVQGGAHADSPRWSLPVRSSAAWPRHCMDRSGWARQAPMR